MKKTAIFLGLTFFLSWPVAFLAFGCGVASYTATWFVVAVYFRFTPSISTVITQKLIYRQNLMTPLRISFRPNWWFLVALLLPGIIALASTVTSLLFPGVSFTRDPTEASSFLFLRQNLTQDQAATLTGSASRSPVHPFFMVLVGGTVAGLTINGVAGFGEELGWRGLLLREFARFGFWRASFAIGVISGLWHLPFILHGRNYPGYPVAGVFVMILWAVFFSPLIGYLCIRANSVIAAAVMHGALNGTAMAPLLMLRGGNVLQIGVMGFAGILLLLCLNLVLFTLGRPEEWHNKWMEMSQEKQDRKDLVAKRRSRAPVVCFGILTCLNALFWFTADFGSFVPPSEGVLRERFLMFGLTEAGPLAFFMLSMGMGDYTFAGVITVIILVFVFLSVRVPQKKALTIAACIGILLWFFFGSCVAGLRIT